ARWSSRFLHRFGGLLLAGLTWLGRRDCLIAVDAAYEGGTDPFLVGCDGAFEELRFPAPLVLVREVLVLFDRVRRVERDDRLMTGTGRVDFDGAGTDEVTRIDGGPVAGDTEDPCGCLEQ